VATGKSLRSFDGHTGGANLLLYAPDGKRLVSGSKDHSIRVWKVKK
jgi:WD40 repeat protein